MPLAGFAGRLYGKHAGAAPRILLLHGFTGDARDWGLWPEHAPAALAIDLPGHGASPDPTGGFADEIGRLLAALPPSIERLVGYSLGGRIALSLIAAAPARLSGATILSAHPGLDNAQQRRERRRDDQHGSDCCKPKASTRSSTPGSGNRCSRPKPGCQRRCCMHNVSEGWPNVPKGLPATWLASAWQKCPQPGPR